MTSTQEPASPAARSPGWPWGYPAHAGQRDLRIDFLRGLAILFVVVDHIDVPSLYHLVSHERIANVTGAEMFVVLSGLVLGMVYRRRAVDEGWSAVATRIWARARLLYTVSLAVMLTIYALSFFPFLDAAVVTSWTDPANGNVYSLYPTTPRLTEYPVPIEAVRDIVLLNVGPSQFNVIGLYVVLLALAPLAFRLLLADRWWVLLAVTWTLYLLNALLRIRLIPSQFESGFPLLSWQLLFFHGMVVGFYWKGILAWFNRPLGRLTIVASVSLFLVFLFIAWNNPLTEIPYDLRLRLIPDEVFVLAHETYFQRDFLGILRLLNLVVLLITLYALLSKLWVPLNAALGWLLVPLGGATLYVFIVHVYFTLIVANIPALNAGNIWLNTAAHTIILLLLLLMIKREVLFRWIPR